MFYKPKLEEDASASLVQIAGLVRFSYPCVGGFQKKGVQVYAARRMEERFKYFEALCLHSLCAQTDKDFSIGVLIGADMPAKYRERLEKLLLKLPQAQLITLSPLPYAEAIRIAFKKLFIRGAPFHLSFRLDDDDAVATDFIANVRAKLPQLFTLSGGLDPVGLSFLKGLTLIGAKPDRQLVASVDARPLGLGLCVMVPQSRQVNALMYQHQNLHMHMPVIMDPYPLMNLRAFHLSNDSEIKLPAGHPVALGEGALRAALKKRFALDMNTVLAL